MKDILIVLKEQIPFIVALIIGVICHTLAGAVKHNQDFEFRKMLLGALKFAGILATIILIIVGINIYEPLTIKFSKEIEVLQEVIVVGVYAKVIGLIKDYFSIKDEDIQKYIDTRNYGEEYDRQ